MKPRAVKEAVCAVSYTFRLMVPKLSISRVNDLCSPISYTLCLSFLFLPIKRQIHITKCAGTSIEDISNKQWGTSIALYALCAVYATCVVCAVWIVAATTLVVAGQWVLSHRCPCVLCLVFHVLCPMPCVPCLVFHVLCSMSCVQSS